MGSPDKSPGGANLRHDWNNQVHDTSKLRFPHAKKLLRKLPQFGHAPSKILGQKSVKNIGLKGPQITNSVIMSHTKGIFCLIVNR